MKLNIIVCVDADVVSRMDACNVSFKFHDHSTSLICPDLSRKLRFCLSSLFDPTVVVFHTVSLLVSS
jgi:hypothetical protein